MMARSKPAATPPGPGTPGAGLVKVEMQIAVVPFTGSIGHEIDARRPGGTSKKIIFFALSWNVVDNKGPKMRKMGQMRIPWNVYENTQLNLTYPGMLLINIGLVPFAPVETVGLLT